MQFLHSAALLFVNCFLLLETFILMIIWHLDININWICFTIQQVQLMSHDRSYIRRVDNYVNDLNTQFVGPISTESTSISRTISPIISSSSPNKSTFVIAINNHSESTNTRNDNNHQPDVMVELPMIRNKSSHHIHSIVTNPTVSNPINPAFCWQKPEEHAIQQLRLKQESDDCWLCWLEVYRLKRKIIPKSLECLLWLWSILFCNCCYTPFIIERVLMSLRYHIIIGRFLFWSSGVLFIIMGFITLGFYIQRLDVIQIFPCITTAVWSSYETCDGNGDIDKCLFCQFSCIRTYRSLEWRYPQQPDGTLHSHNIAESSCSTSFDGDNCSSNSVSLLAQARSYLNKSQSCWIHSTNGHYWLTYGAHDDDTPEESTRKYLNSVITFCTISLIMGLSWYLCRRLYHSLKSLPEKRLQYHLYHTHQFLSFLRGVYRPTTGTPLYHFVHHPCYDHNLLKLMGSYL